MTQQRLISLDMLRGLAMAGMILVNNPGSWSHIYVPLEHSVWNGLTPTDLVFPFFVFAMGMAMGFSTKGLTASRASYLRKVMKRSVLLFVIGLLLTLLGRWLNTGELCFSQLRVMGVLQRLSLSYLVVALIVRRVKGVPTMTFVVVALLSGYWVLLLLGHGFDFSANNIVAVVDRWLLGETAVRVTGTTTAYPSSRRHRCIIAAFWFVAKLHMSAEQKDMESDVRHGHFGLCPACVDCHGLVCRPQEAEPLGLSFSGFRQ